MQHFQRKKFNQAAKAIALGLFAVGIMVLSGRTSYAQDCQPAVSVQPGSSQISTNAAIGQSVTIQVTLGFSDPDDPAEGEGPGTLTLSSSGIGQKVFDTLGTTSFTFTVLQDKEIITAFYQDVDGDETASVQVCVSPCGSQAAGAPSGPSCGKIQIPIADIRTDRIQVILSPASDSGQLVLTAVGDKTTTLFTGVKAGGTYIFSFNPTSLANGEYTQVRGVWTVKGVASNASKTVAFNVLGTYRHSQYNVPDENACPIASSLAYITNASCIFKKDQLRSLFISQANLNGSGHSIKFGDVRREAFCIKPEQHPPAGAVDHSFRPAPISPTCGTRLDGTTVARNKAHPLLKCGDEVLIVGLGSSPGTVKTVTDECPACGFSQLDNFTPKTTCLRITTDVGSFVTIRLR